MIPWNNHISFVAVAAAQNGSVMGTGVEFGEGVMKYSHETGKLKTDTNEGGKQYPNVDTN